MLALGVRKFTVGGVEVEFAPEAVAKALLAAVPSPPQDALSVQRDKQERARKKVVSKLERELRSV